MIRISTLPGMRTLGLFSLLLVSMWMMPALGAKLNRYSYFNAHASGTLTPNTTLGADAAFYNPAGTAFGPEGFHFQLGNVTTYGDYYFAEVIQSSTSVRSTQFCRLSRLLGATRTWPYLASSFHKQVDSSMSGTTRSSSTRVVTSSLTHPTTHRLIPA